MKWHPIIFTAQSVREILAGRKTQTRRLVNPQPERSGDVHNEPAYFWPHRRGWSPGYWHTNEDALIKLMPAYCPYGARDSMLWVKETWSWPRPTRHYLTYRADAEFSEKQKRAGRKWRSPLFMPQHASRLHLRILEVRVERLNHICTADAIAEGCAVALANKTPVQEFMERWDQINGDRAPAQSRPFVWVVRFEKIRSEKLH
jgi:hypothetical protein